jgi:hypothetical protein
MVGLCPRLAQGRNAQPGPGLIVPHLIDSGLVTLGHMRGPSLAGLRLDVGESRARRRIGNTDQVIARGALNLATGVARITLQRLIAV